VRHNDAVRAQVLVIAGPSGSGKSRLARRLGFPVLNLDDFYKDGSDPTLPRLAMGVVDWDDPASWLQEEAVEAVAALCREGEADVPVYDIARDGRVGRHRLPLDGAPYFVAEGIFAQEIVQDCRERGLLADAVCVRNHRLVTFWRRLTRDLRESRKPPRVLVRRGLLLMQAEPSVVAHAVTLGCVALSPDEAKERLTRLTGSAARS
jgi:uridine kinase